ncbi:MAG: 3-carboxy-cis,cis-muconate cycloisomerase [Candidatus Parcubacteria bacterium]|nr:3-carboxy-cis,cis-muconate cycloisomerase [Burkholderiales bacterium]
MSALQHAFWDEACAQALSDDRLLSAMARFEGALALSSARIGVIPVAAARTIAEVAAAASFDAAALASAARRASTLAIPFVLQLTEKVAAVSEEAARYVHFGATSQDVIDTAVVLCVVPAAGRLTALSDRLGDALAAIAARHAQTPTVARTLLQPAVPVSFGWKAAVWLSMLSRSRSNFRVAARAACVLQFGGAGGTLSAYASKGDTIAAELAAELGLPRAPVTWHSARDGFARLGSEAAILAGTAGKIARDVSLLMQSEVGEVSEPTGEGRGGSSAMPHKRNPVGCLAALEAAYRAPGLTATLLAQLAPEHERGIGHWQSQWFTLRDLLCAAGSGLSAMAEVMEGLKVDERAMRANLDRSHGLVYSENVAVRLSRTLGKQAAHALTEKLCRIAAREGRELYDVVRADSQAAAAIEAGEFSDLFNPASSFGASAAMIERAIQDWSQARQN